MHLPSIYKMLSLYLCAPCPSTPTPHARAPHPLSTNSIPAYSAFPSPSPFPLLFYRPVDHRDPPSFPTRRSSDLVLGHSRGARIVEPAMGAVAVVVRAPAGTMVP